MKTADLLATMHKAMVKQHGELFANIMILTAKRSMRYHEIEKQFKTDGDVRERIRELNKADMVWHRELKKLCKGWGRIS